MEIVTVRSRAADSHRRETHAPAACPTIFFLVRQREGEFGIEFGAPALAHLLTLRLDANCSSTTRLIQRASRRTRRCHLRTRTRPRRSCSYLTRWVAFFVGVGGAFERARVPLTAIVTCRALRPPSREQEGCREDLLATTGDFLRVWKVQENGVVLKSLLNNNKNSEFCAPLTSFDWNETVRCGRVYSHRQSRGNIELGSSRAWQCPSVRERCHTPLCPFTGPQEAWHVKHRYDVHHLGHREGGGRHSGPSLRCVRTRGQLPPAQLT